MSAAIPTTEPESARAGDTWKWRREDLSDYPAPTWTLKYRFKNAAGGFEVVATADGSSFAVTVPHTTTDDFAAGDYEYVAWVEGGGERYTVKAGAFKVLPNLTAAAATDALDTRSHARKALDAIEAVIEGRATKDQEAYTINGRSVQRTPLAELITFRDRYRAEVRREEQAARLAAGLPSRKGIFVRFRRA